MKEIFTKATISNVRIENGSGVYERTLTAEIDGANEIIWLTDTHINTVVTPNIDETRSIAITKKQLDELSRVMARVEA